MALARILLGPALAAGVLLAPSASQAQPVIALQSIATGLARPVAITHAGDGSGRLFITLQGGQIVVYDGIQILPTPFLDISDRVMVPTDPGNEFGLLSVAFHPQYVTNGFFYVHYSSLAGDVVIARYQVTANPNVADHDSELILLPITHDQGDNHWGGQLQFGPDGFLYVAVGDGGEGGDPEDDAQSLGVLLGKLLRLDVDASPPYIPASNPFVGTPMARGEIWAYGLRNPWRFAFDRATGDLFIGDVGQATREEIDFQPAASAGGENYGWNRLEGTFCFNPAPPGCNDPSFIPPILELDTTANNCSIIGGYRYRGRRFPPLRGFYLYADFCMRQILGATRNADGTWTSTLLLDTGFFISTFGEDQAGELYLASYDPSGAANGAIHRIVMPGVPVNPTPLLTGAGAGGGPHVRGFGATGAQTPVSFFAYPLAFTGGARVATGDIDGDGIPDIITAAGPGGGPHIRVFSGADPAVELASFFAYDPAFTGGVFVAAGDVNGDGVPDIITGAGPGGGPHVKVFSGAALPALVELASFFAYDPAFTGGVRVAAGDINGDGRADIITGAGPGGGPHVKVFSGTALPALVELASFFAYDPAFTGGLFVAAGDVNGDGFADIVTGADAGGGPHVRVFSGFNLAVELASLFAYAPAFTGGVRVAAGDVNGDGRADIVTGPGPGGGPHVRVLSAVNLAVELASFFAYVPAFTGGVFVAGFPP